MENPPVSEEINERQSASWDVQNAPKNYVSLVISQIASSFFAFAAVWLITRYLGSEKYGGVAAIIAASQVVQVLINWTSLAVVRFGVDEFIETQRIARVFWLRFFMLLPNLALVLLASRLWFPPLAGWLKLPPEAFWLVTFHFAAAVLWLHVQYGFQAIKMPRMQGALQAFERVLIFASLVVFLVAGKLDVTAAAICYAGIPLVMTLVGLWFLRKYIFAKFPVDWKFCLKVLSFSAPLMVFTFSTYLSGGYADAAFIANFLSIRDLGIYAVAVQINGIALQLPTLANTLLLPLFVSLQKEAQFSKMQNYFLHILPMLILFWGAFVTLVSFAGCFALPLIFGAEFAAAVAPVWILLAGSTLNLPVLLGYASVSNAGSTTYISMYAAILAAVTNISLNFLLIPIFGLKGCAWASALMYLVASTSFAFLLKRASNTPISWTFAAIIPTASGAVLFSLTENPWLSLAVCLALSILVIYIKKTSFRESVVFLRRLRNA